MNVLLQTPDGAFGAPTPYSIGRQSPSSRAASGSATRTATGAPTSSSATAATDRVRSSRASCRTPTARWIRPVSYPSYDIPTGDRRSPTWTRTAARTCWSPTRVLGIGSASIASFRPAISSLRSVYDGLQRQPVRSAGARRRRHQRRRPARRGARGLPPTGWSCFGTSRRYRRWRWRSPRRRAGRITSARLSPFGGPGRYRCDRRLRRLRVVRQRQHLHADRRLHGASGDGARLPVTPALVSSTAIIRVTARDRGGPDRVRGDDHQLGAPLDHRHLRRPAMQFIGTNSDDQLVPQPARDRDGADRVEPRRRRVIRDADGRRPDRQRRRGASPGACTGPADDHGPRAGHRQRQLAGQRPSTTSRSDAELDRHGARGGRHHVHDHALDDGSPGRPTSHHSGSVSRRAQSRRRRDFPDARGHDASNTGTFTTVQVPGPGSANARVRVTTTNGFVERGRRPARIFTLVQPTAAVTSSRGRRHRCTPGRTMAITWTSNLPATSLVTVELSRDGGSTLHDRWRRTCRTTAASPGS